MTEANPLAMWTVYEHPADYPNLFVARMWLILAGGDTMRTHTVLKAATLEELRRKLPPGLVCITRSDNDPSHVVETWL